MKLIFKSMSASLKTKNKNIVYPVSQHLGYNKKIAIQTQVIDHPKFVLKNEKLAKKIRTKTKNLFHQEVHLKHSQSKIGKE